MKKNLFVFCILLFSFDLFAQTENSEFSWKILETAQVEFDNANYGVSLNLCNKAKSKRKEELLYEYNMLDISLSPRQVKRVGEEFKDVIPVLQEREQKESLRIIDNYIKIYGSEFFNNSVYELLSWLKAKQVYPEADFLIGRIYQLEGEYITAQKFFESARKEAKYLDIPDFEYEILYAMVNLAKEIEDYDQLEKLLLLILDKDENFRDTVLQSALLRTIDTDSEVNVDKFFMLYRAESNFSIRAIYELANLYEKKGDSESSLKCYALCSVEAFTHIYNIIVEKDPSYKYFTFADFLYKCSLYDDIVKWGMDNNIWKMFFEFSDSVGKSGKLVFARKLYTDISVACPDSYIRTLASTRIN